LNIRRNSKNLPSALEADQHIAQRLIKRQAAVFLDYDGTLTPIVKQPEDAVLSEPMRAVLKKLAGLCITAVVSGRDRANVEQMVGLQEVIYAGSHGFDISGPPGIHMVHEGGQQCLPALDAAEERLRTLLQDIPGARVERKRFALAVHYRNAPPDLVERIQQTAKDIQQSQPRLRLSGGKKIFELRPDVDWDKGKAVEWLLRALDLDRPTVEPFYIGDDVTDEDAFRALRDKGVPIVVGHPQATAAQYRLENVEEVKQFLNRLAQQLETRNHG